MKRVSIAACPLITLALGTAGCDVIGIGVHARVSAPVVAVAVAPPPPATVVVEQPGPAPVVVEAAPVAVEGTVRVRIEGVPSDYPDYVPVYTNSKVVMSARGGAHGKRGYVLELVTPDPPATVTAFYKSQMGYAPTAEVDMGGQHMLVYADRSRRNKFSVWISGGAGQTAVILAAENGAP